MGIDVRTHGGSGPLVAVLHGGPAAPGSVEGLVRGLADRCRVLEPLQRGSGAEPLGVAVHVADLHAALAEWGAERPILVGHSWGAMLALAYAAEHPRGARALVLVGCGTFDPVARARLRERRGQRADSFDPVEPEPGPELEGFDRRAHEETWADMLRLQEEGVYPAAFAAIEVPVLMLHGDVDPHPGPVIAAGLRRHVPWLEYHELARCGHYPWLERHARHEFFRRLHAALDG